MKKAKAQAPAYRHYNTPVSAPAFQAETGGGLKITKPGMSVDPATVLDLYSKGLEVATINTYYDTLQGLDPDNWPKTMPIDVSKLTTIEKHIYSNELRNDVKKLRSKLKSSIYGQTNNDKEDKPGKQDANDISPGSTSRKGDTDQPK